MATPEKLKLQTNIPEVIALEFAEGLPVSGQYGDQVMFTLTDGRKMYLPPFVASKISAAGVPPKVPFTLCKREVAHGNRRTVEYQIGDAFPVKNETAAFGRNAAGPVDSASKFLNHSQSSNTTNHNGTTPALVTPTTPAPLPAPAPVVDGSSTVALLKMAGCGAIDAVLAIEQYAQDRGLVDFVFGAENVQKFAACLFIEMNKKAGRQ